MIKPVAAAAIFAFAACSDDAPPAPRNPDKLWLGLDGSEIQVKLVPVEPDPF